MPAKKKDYPDPFDVKREENGSEDERVSDVIVQAMQRKKQPEQDTNAFGIPRAASRPRPVKIERKKQPYQPARDPKVSYRCFPAELKTSINRLAAELKVPVGHLVHFMFVDGLYEYNQDRLSFHSTLSPIGYTMYPAEQRPRGKPPKGTTAPDQTVVTFHGVPRQLDEQIQEIAEQIGVPKGEVARRLIEFGIERHRRPKTRITAEILTDFLQNRNQP